LRTRPRCSPSTSPLSRHSKRLVCPLATPHAPSRDTTSPFSQHCTHLMSLAWSRGGDCRRAQDADLLRARPRAQPCGARPLFHFIYLICPFYLFILFVLSFLFIHFFCLLSLSLCSTSGSPTWCAPEPRPYTLNSEPYTLHPTPSALNPKS